MISLLMDQNSPFDYSSKYIYINPTYMHNMYTLRNNENGFYIFQHNSHLYLRRGGTFQAGVCLSNYINSFNSGYFNSKRYAMMILKKHHKIKKEN